MPTVKNFLLHSFENNPDQPRVSIEVPQGSTFLVCKAVPQGIMVWYEIPTLFTEKKWEHFKILGKSNEIPENSKFIEIIDVVVPGPDGEQVLIIMPVYKLL